MEYGSLILSGRGWLWYAAGLLVLVLGVLVWGYRAAPAGGMRWLCAMLKLVGVAALAFCLLEPLWSGRRARPGANLVAVLADNSQSLQVKDRGSARSRSEGLMALVNPPRAAWQRALEENFELRRYYFDARLQATRDFAEVTCEGRTSALGAALRALAERYRGRPLAGIVLLSDGNATDWHGTPDLAGLPPVYPVVVGSAEPVRDLAVGNVKTTQTDFEDAPVSVQGEVKAFGYSGQAVIVRLLDRAGKTVAQQKLEARTDADSLGFRFQLRPDKPGLSFYRLSVRSGDEDPEADRPAPTREATLANNVAVLTVDRGDGPYRILYVSGRPNWEFKFLNRALQEDPQLQLVGLIRVARREPRFNFIGRAGESSNPLFRGFGTQSPEEVERYDQPVLVRFNTRDESELRAGFPRTAEELYAYQAVVVDDLEAEFFTPDQAMLLQKFVSERGGGFMMLGGMECYQEGKYERTPIGEMLPVYLDRRETAGSPGPVRLDLTREGWLESWARLRDNEADEKARLQAMVPFQVLNRVSGAKPGASVIATATDAAGRSVPALVVQRFGRGRTAAVTLGDVWRWGLHDPEAHADMDKAWRQLMRWLVNEVPRRVELAVEPQPNDSRGAVRLQVRARDKEFQPLDNAAVYLEVEPVTLAAANNSSTNTVDGAAVTTRLQVEASAQDAGLYEATYIPRLTGGYRATVCVTNAEGAEVGRAVAGWSTDLAADEFRSLSPNVALLEAIARRTGGAVIAANDLESFARRLPHRQAPVMEAWTFPLWHTPVLFGFALACLVSEWGLRRWKGLP